MTRAAYEKAREYVGLKEVPGPQHNSTILTWFRKVGHSWVQDDETPWCAAFAGAMLEYVGVPSTRKLNARSYLTWGRGLVDIKYAQKGDIVVLWRGSPGAATGHVAFYHSHNDSSVTLLGGNQSNMVNFQGYPRSRILGIRRYVNESKPSQPSGGGFFAWLARLLASLFGGGGSSTNTNRNER